MYLQLPPTTCCRSMPSVLVTKTVDGVAYGKYSRRGLRHRVVSNQCRSVDIDIREAARGPRLGSGGMRLHLAAKMVARIAMAGDES